MIWLLIQKSNPVFYNKPVKSEKLQISAFAKNTCEFHKNPIVYVIEWSAFWFEFKKLHSEVRKYFLLQFNLKESDQSFQRRITEFKKKLRQLLGWFPSLWCYFGCFRERGWPLRHLHFILIISHAICYSVCPTFHLHFISCLYQVTLKNVYLHCFYKWRYALWRVLCVWGSLLQYLLTLGPPLRSRVFLYWRTITKSGCHHVCLLLSLKTHLFEEICP